MEASKPLDANLVPSGEKQTEQTPEVCSSKMLFYSPIFASQKRMELSALPETNVVLSIEKQTELI